MKNAFLFILLIVTTLITPFCFSQFTQEENEMMAIIKEHGAYIPKSLFLDTSTIKHMSLANSTTWRNLWVDQEDSIKNIKQIYDIRLKFDSQKEALKFHKKYLHLNSEYAPKIKSHGIKHEGSTDFQVYSGGVEYTKMMEPYGYQIFCFLYVVDGYFVKQYITCLKEYTPSTFQYFIDSTISKIKNKK